MTSCPRPLGLGLPLTLVAAAACAAVGRAAAFALAAPLAAPPCAGRALRGAREGPAAAEGVQACVAAAAAAALTLAGISSLALRSPKGVRGAATAVAASIMRRTGEEAEEESEEEPEPFDPAHEIGVTQPLGYFDPLGFCKVGDKDGFRKLRASELKHGRVAMMAAAGSVAQYFFRLPIFFDLVPSGLQAAYTGNGKYGFFWAMVVAAWLELTQWVEDPLSEPGDFGDPLGFNIYDDDMRNKELNNGRAGMIAAFGIIAAELYTGKDAMEQFGLAPSPYEVGTF